MTGKGLLGRIREEIAHWVRKDWSFGDVGGHWDSVEDYDAINEETYSYFRRFVDGYRLSSLPASGRVLDFCARTGNGTVYFYQRGAVGSAVCADVSLRMGAVCRERVREAGLQDFLWVPVDRFPLPLEGASFDTVLCFESIEHFPHPEIFVSELSRLTRPGGVLILTTPNVLWEPVHALAAITGLHHSEGPHHFVRLKRLARLVREAGFEIEALETTVLVPGGPKFLVRSGEWLEARTRRTLMPLLGLRRVIVARRVG